MKIKYPSISFSPIQKILFSFIMLIGAGVILLLLPFSTHKGISFINAVFTSTSAVCVTGLIVLDTAKDFTFFGKAVILMLIQLGGIGIMTFSLAVVMMIGGNLSIKWRFTLENIYSDIKKLSVKGILKRILLYTFTIELIVSIILFTQFIRDFPFFKAAGHSVFHAVSSFCNAGFSTFSNSLINYKSNSVVILTTAAAIILGGLGFIVMNEIARSKKRGFKKFIKDLTLHTRLVLLLTVIFILLGMVTFIILEKNYSLKNYSAGDSILTSFFQSVTCRTAGFNSIDISSLRESTLFMMIFLMFIGGSPGSIAGGVKTTTIGVIFLLIYSKFRGKEQVIIWGRALDKNTIEKSTTLILVSLLFVMVSTFFMLTVKDFDIGHSFMSVMFETVSAFGTVGLSTGITDKLPVTDKVLLSVIMFLGRLGPLTFIMALTSRKKKAMIEYPAEHIMIG